MAVTTKKTFPATSNSTTTTFGPIGIELNNQDDLDVYITLSGGTRVLQYKQSSASTTDSNHPQVNDTTGLYFPPVSAGVALKNYTISADNNNVIFNSALPSGAVVSVERRTRDSSSSYTSFSGGSTIRSTDLNTAFDETRFTAQEGRNKAFDLERQTFSEDGNIRLLEDQSLVYEGATDDAYETTLAITDPTADRTITFPNVSGTVVTTGDTGTVAVTMMAANSVDSDQYVDGSVDLIHLSANSVDSSKIVDGSITNADISSSAAIDASKIVSATPSVAGTISSADKAKLDGIEAGATADQSNAEIRAAVEAATDSNVFTDADHTKLNGIEASATADQSNAEIRTAVEAASDSNVFTDADHTKLNGIEASATADQSGAEIKTAYEAESNTNAYTDAEKTKLAGIDTSADVTDATTVNAAGAVMNSDLDAKGEILVGDGSGDPTAFPASTTNGHILTIDTTEATGMKWAANAGAGGGGSSLIVLDESTTLTNDATKLKFVGAGVAATEPSADEITITVTGDLVQDTTPQLGGALDVQAQEINTSTTNGNIKLTPNGTGVVEVKGNTNPGTIQLNCENNSHGVKLKGPAHSAAASYTLTLPNDDGSANEVLKTDGSGNLAWVAQTTDTNTQLSNAEVRTAVEAASDSNVFTDADHTKLNAIEASATADQTAAEIRTLVESATDSNVFTDADHTKLNGIEASATADQTNAEIRAAVEAATDSNVFTDADHTKLNGIATSANAYVHPNHSGEVTSTADGATVIASDIVDEDNLKISNAGSNGQFLQKQSGNTGGLTWATVAGTITALNNQTANRLTTIGSTTTELDGEANLTFEDTTATGLISGKQITGRGFECPATVSDDWTIAAGNNAFFPGPMTVAANKTVTVPANRTLTIV